MDKQKKLRSKDQFTFALHAAKALISLDGFHAFSSRRLARTIGCSVGTIHNLFEGYDGLVIHINAMTLDDLLAFLQENYGSTQTPEKCLEDFAFLYYRFSQKHPYRFRMLFNYHLQQREHLPEWYLNKTVSPLAMLSSELAKQFHIKDPEVAKKNAHLFWSCVHGICILALSDAHKNVGSDTTETMLRDIAANYTAGMRALLK